MIIGESPGKLSIRGSFPCEIFYRKQEPGEELFNPGLQDMRLHHCNSSYSAALVS